VCIAILDKKTATTSWTASVSLEVKATMKAEIPFTDTGVDMEYDVGISSEWSREFSMETTWDNSKENSIQVKVSPGHQLNISQLVASYGIRQLQVYSIKGTTLYITEAPCGGNGGKVKRYLFNSKTQRKTKVKKFNV